eukprot:4316661-Prymnesium_polylepis.2
MSSLHGRHPCPPASWGGRIARSSPHSEPVGITPAVPWEREYRLHHLITTLNSIALLLGRGTAWYYTSQFGAPSSMSLAATSLTRALRQPLRSFSIKGGASRFFQRGGSDNCKPWLRLERRSRSTSRALS